MNLIFHNLKFNFLNNTFLRSAFLLNWLDLEQKTENNSNIFFNFIIKSFAINLTTFRFFFTISNYLNNLVFFSCLFIRSPSPEPIYGTDGKRLNTREYRMRRKLEEERHSMITKMVTLNPEFKPPGDYK